MLTRCPACATRFLVNKHQLYTADGKVRCGRCAHVFLAQVHDVDVAAATVLSPPKPVHHLSTTIRTGMTMLLMLMLVLQWAWWQRNWLVTLPYIGIMVVGVCQFLPCKLKTLHIPEQIVVLERTLEADPVHANLLHFRLLMMNSATIPQALPLLELSLLNASGELVGQRRFNSEQYLPPNDRSIDIMWPGVSVPVELDIWSSATQTLGFEVEFKQKL